jgi:TPR repeat protein
LIKNGKLSIETIKIDIIELKSSTENFFHDKFNFSDFKKLKFIQNRTTIKITMNNSQIQDENEQLQHGGSQNSPQQIILSPLVQEGMKLIRSKLWDEEGYKKAFPLFKKAADENKDVEACWRVAACYCMGLGIDQNQEKALKYAKIAFDANSIDGIFWFGNCQESDYLKFKFYKLASERNHIGAKYVVGILIFQRDVFKDNSTEGH